MLQCVYSLKSTLIGSELPPARMAGNSVLLVGQGSSFPSSGLYPALEGKTESRTFIGGVSGLRIIFLI